MSHKEKDPALEPALRDVESIASLDTARLALRWALERMRALERRATDLEGDLKTANDAQAKASAELDAAQSLLSRRAAEGLERERYYAKIEEYLTLKLAGGLDPAALAKREAALEEREAGASRREVEAERAVRAAESKFDEERRRSAADSAAAADARVAEVREEFERRASAREREAADRIVALHEKEAQLAALERSLEERRRRFEEFFAAQRASLARESSAINEAASDQAAFLERRVEQALALKAKALEAAWRGDKEALLAELASWREKAREHLPAFLEASAKAGVLEDEKRRLAEENRQILAAKVQLTEELTRWRAQAQSDLPALLAAVRRAVEAEERSAHLEVELASVRRRAEEHLAEIMSVELSEEGRLRELSKLESALSAKLRDAEQNLFRQYDRWLQREDELRHRDQDWRRESEARLGSVEALRAEITAQREELKRAIAAYRAKAEAFARDEDRRNGEKR